MFKYKTLKEDLQKKLFIGKVQNLTNAGLIKSEVEYKRYMNGILSSLNAHNEQLFNTKDIDIKYSDIISFKTFKENLELVYYDLFTSYSEIDNIKKVLRNNLNKNKQFYRNIRERIRHYRKHLSLVKMNTYDVTISNKSYMESFFDYNKNFKLDNCIINPKTNKLELKPYNVERFNNSIDIDRVDLLVAPSNNNDGGVYYTHKQNNDISKNYETGKRNMLKEGLWKLQILTEGVPESYLNINGNNVKYNGIVATLDIYFTGMKPINRLYIEPYGEFYLNIVGIQYLDGVNWKPLRYYEVNEEKYYQIGGQKLIFDFVNIEPVSTNAIRIVFNQENYKLLDNYITEQTDAFSQIFKEIQENRYDSIKQINFEDKYLTKPFDARDDKATLIEQIYDIILSTNSFSETEKKIRELIFPQLKTINFNSNWRVYELGAWEIVPQYAQYSNNIGTFTSHSDGGYLFDKSPLQVILTTKDELPEQTSIEYFVTNENENRYVPILPANTRNRKEADRFCIYPVMQRSTQMPPDYHIMKLDYPIHIYSKPFTSIFINGEEKFLDTTYNENVAFYNSRFIYIDDIKFNKNDNYVVNYFPSKTEIVEVWVLKPNNNLYDTLPHEYDFGAALTGDDPGLFLDQYVTFPTEDAAKEFLHYFDKKYSSTAYMTGSLTMKKSYTPVKTYSHVQEFNSWFGDGIFPVFVDTAGIDIYDPIMQDLLDDFPYTLLRGDLTEIRYNSRYTRSSWLFPYVKAGLSPLNSDYLPVHYGGELSLWLDKYPSIMVA